MHPGLHLKEDPVAESLLTVLTHPAKGIQEGVSRRDSLAMLVLEHLIYEISIGKEG